jgi:hypothetical protein
VRQPFFGVSAAGYRLEGGFNGPGEPQNQWSAWERAGKRPTAQWAGSGTGIWEDPDRLLDAASAAGAEAVALSVEWARIEPAPDRRDQSAVERYAGIFSAARERGIAPIAVLYDVAHPAWLGEEFWLTPGSPDRFGEHVGRLVAALSPACRQWVTLRQPNTVAIAGWVLGRHPPCRVGALADAWAVVDNFLSAHLLAYAAIRDAQPDAEVVLGLRASRSYDWHRMMVDLLCAPALGVERGSVGAWIARRRAVHDDAVAPEDLGELVWRRMAGTLSPFGPGRFRRPSPGRALDLAYALWDRPVGGSNGLAPQAVRYPLDALLLGWTPPHATGSPFPVSRATAPWEVRPDPDALSEWCRGQARATPGLPLWIEDGFATRRGAARADGWDRPSYVRAQLSALDRNDGPGVNVEGYLEYAYAGGGDPTWPDAEFGPAAGTAVAAARVSGRGEGRSARAGRRAPCRGRGPGP